VTEVVAQEGVFDIIRMEIHRYWGNPLDIFGNEQTMARYLQFMDIPDGGERPAPQMLFNGIDNIEGATSHDQLYQDLNDRSRLHEADNATSWFLQLDNLQEVQPYDPGARGGEVYTVDARVLVVGELDDSIPVFYAFAYKTGIHYVNPWHPDQDHFYDVVRTVKGPTPLNEAPYALSERGDEAVIPLEIHFPTGEQFESPATPEPDFEGYGIVILVQTAAEFPDGRIHQAARMTWDRE
jgi:hypothetical protein